jgi:hypothetical protein
MVQIQNEIADKVAEKDVTRILGQPTNQSIDLLEQELTIIAASIRSTQGNAGHAGMIMDDAEYMAAFNMVAPFEAPVNPGVYPIGPFPAGTRNEREAQHEKLFRCTRLIWESLMDL